MPTRRLPAVAIVREKGTPRGAFSLFMFNDRQASIRYLAR